MRYVLRENKRGKKAKYPTALAVKKGSDTLTFTFFCENSEFYSAYKGYNKPIYEGDVAEVFISFDGSLTDYYEIEAAPNGSVFFAKIHNNGIKPQIEFLENVVDVNIKTENKSYTCVINVPLSKFEVKDGKNIKFNAFRIETRGGKSSYLMALNPTLCDTFHKPEYFVDLKE